MRLNSGIYLQPRRIEGVRDGGPWVGRGGGYAVARSAGERTPSEVWLLLTQVKPLLPPQTVSPGSQEKGRSPECETQLGPWSLMAFTF